MAMLVQAGHSVLLREAEAQALGTWGVLRG
jgi:hypothetical protein